MSAFVVHLMRHGAPVTPGLMLGHSDAPVTPAGIAACVAQAGALSFQAIVSSDLQRAAVAADAIGARRGIAGTRDARWRELDFGVWDGLAPDAVDRAAIGAFWDDPDANPPPGGERWSALVARVGAALEALPARDTLIVTHGGAIRAAMAHLFGFGQRQIWAFDLPYAAVATLRVWPGSPPGLAASAQIVGLST
ncbi:histidine phosphatase family protein [Novosphingobium sp.]|uniref:histidine phosphatase family protein n=1 Tax=Novosphingobium sp. TaxID=1874826 RepID=UPI003B51CA44